MSADALTLAICLEAGLLAVVLGALIGLVWRCRKRPDPSPGLCSPSLRRGEGRSGRRLGAADRDHEDDRRAMRAVDGWQ